MKLKTLSMMIVMLFAALLLVSSVTAYKTMSINQNFLHTCAISTGHGLLQDFDCDKIPDQIDNCPDFFNPNQKDSNRDNVGDVCASAYGLSAQGLVIEKGYVAIKVGKVPERSNTPKPDFEVDIKELQDIYIGSAGAVYPIKIKNTGRNSQRISFQAVGVDFGTYRIDPSALLILEAGETKTAYLHVAAEEGTEEGDRTFDLIISTENEKRTITMNAMLLNKRSRSGMAWGDILGWFLIIIVILVLLAIAAREFQQRNGGKSRQLNEDIYSYY